MAFLILNMCCEDVTDVRVKGHEVHKTQQVLEQLGEWAVEVPDNVVMDIDPPPMDFRQRVDHMMNLGLDDDEVLERLDPDTAGEDLVALVRVLLKERK